MKTFDYNWCSEMLDTYMNECMKTNGWVYQKAAMGPRRGNR